MHNLLKSAFYLDFRQNITPPVEVTHFNTTNGSLIFHSLPLNHHNLGNLITHERWVTRPNCRCRGPGLSTVKRTMSVFSQHGVFWALLKSSKVLFTPSDLLGLKAWNYH